MSGSLQQKPYEEDLTTLPLITKELADLKFALDQSSIVAVTDAAGKIIYVNDQFIKVSKYSEKELIGQDHRMINSGYHSKQFFQQMWKTIRSGKVWKGEIRNKAKDGSLYWVHATIIPIMNSEGVPERYIAIRTEITERKVFEEQALYLAYNDELTNLPNRRKFKKDLKEKMETLTDDDNGLSVIFLDLDRFKYINDTKGHAFGDYVLKSVVSKMMTQLDTQARMYRLGGDEFTIIFESSHYQEVEEQANRLLHLFNSPFRFGDDDYFLSLSIGISVYPFHGENFDSLVKSADIAMYRAKELGGNRVEYYTCDLIKDIEQEMMLENELRKAIDRNEFTVVYQPKVNLANQLIVGVEALIRWNHLELGIIPPIQFIPLAEKTGLIIPISQFILQKVCQDMMKWKNEGHVPIRVAINFSPTLFAENNLINFVKQVLQESNINPCDLELEMTEIVMINHESALIKINELKSLGIHISIDDFGTGFSSLSHLKRFPIDTLKIDISFIREIGNSPEDNAMVKTIIDIANNLGLNVVAEGIETKEQFEFLANNKCTEGQGYFFSYPVTSEEIEEIILFPEKVRMI
ncbi:EAL domain-containing protein [Neobacillus pocheonensis]|uniref:putative bifunctional diguanylate cyclase/phosphodiesterase n=1 Tax=Neobacillus pocheonensis TaxID=363869 RepID=UPI003D27BAA5